jgi:alkanesulfonate monooxygenase SsuD/methylene tetrahydromethanopterin reductase-like flavin-dependent oxidoreductase (luciferase family)
MWLFRVGLKYGPFATPPGYVTERSMKAMLAARVKPFTDLTMDDLVNEGYVIVGSPDTVAEKLAYYSDRLHAGIMVSGAQWGDMPPDKTRKNMELFASQVMPHFR